ncbi:ATP-binding cassette domain-containing protein [Candidatus Roizmanbacteria bacterium]|nr:ATP-binding cassette domain-containing protein [Candidatus Roizmanbacteria bacterium]
MIIFQNVTKQYPLGNNALENASFEIEDNEFVFLVGPSGAGKTTILKLLVRDTVPSSGTIFVDDQEVSKRKFHDTQRLRRKIGFVFQDFKIIPEKNVFENVAISLEIVKTSKKQVKNEVQEALALVNLTDKARVFPIQLSAGELQRVAIARAIVGNRDLILADEPTGNLDPKTTWEIMRIFKKLEGEKTIVVATHNTDIVNSLKKRVIALKEGRIVADKRKGGYEL